MVSREWAPTGGGGSGLGIVRLVAVAGDSQWRKVEMRPDCEFRLSTKLHHTPKTLLASARFAKALKFLTACVLTSGAAPDKHPRDIPR
ncbi:uncharacterized protein N7458_005264 [Penicillium daleae]|uniref:Uncharacterized protein n=1 Tax=Penicillium daleae TaxID=63821 RepID=A0AAD6C7V0_9EURO|nr:uncharacterized protein N7458_005264 [Penicillium daleae]KAJ5454308.1 hypothetical protein N7458_005264 [Penicillium daleae]